MEKSQYSRRTWTKKTNSASRTTSRSNGCSLCSDGSNPENLSAHVNDGQTCADVHLQLTMLRYDNAMCAVGQEKYQELCCTAATSSGDFNSSLGFVIGAVVAGFFVTKIIFTTRKRRRIRQEAKMYDDEEIPGTVSFSSRSSKNSSRSGSTTDVEMPSSRYVNMDGPKASRSNRGKQGRHPSRSRDRPRVEHDHHARLVKSHSSSRGRGRKENRPRDRPMSRSRPRDMPDTMRSNRDRPMSRSRARSQSRPRDMPADTTHYTSTEMTRYIPPDTVHSSRDRPMSRSRARSQSRPRDMAADTMRSSRDRPTSRSRARSRSRPRDTVEHTRSSSYKPRSRSRAQSRSRPRDMAEDHSISRNRSRIGRSRSQSRARSRPADFEELDLYHGDGSRFPTQVL